MSIFVKDAMTTKVIWLVWDTPFAATAAALREHRVRPRTRTQGHDIIRRARHVRGVVAVRDRLSYPPPGPDSIDVLARFPVD